ncbi:MAG TPA: hypothetical protein VI895_13320 [Bdellovibrionota bacterium]|nr:hypothetical protein [Bdellovibrionota bacterium]
MKSRTPRNVIVSCLLMLFGAALYAVDGYADPTPTVDLYKAYAMKDWPTVERLANERIAVDKGDRIAKTLLGYAAFEKGDIAGAAQIFGDLQASWWHKTRANQFMIDLSRERLNQPTGNILEQAARVYAKEGLVSKCDPFESCVGDDRATSKIMKELEPRLCIACDTKEKEAAADQWFETIRKQLDSKKTKEAAIAAAFIAAHQKQTASLNDTLLEYLRRYPENAAMQAVFMGYVLEKKENNETIKAEFEKVLSRWSKRDPDELTPELLRITLRQPADYCEGTRCEPSKNASTPTCKGLNSNDLDDFMSMDFRKGHFSAPDSETARLVYDQIVKYNPQIPSVPIAWAIIGLRASSTFNSTVRVKVIRLARHLKASMCETLSDKGIPQAVKLGESALLMADSLRRSSDNVVGFSSAWTSRRILEKGLESIYEKSNDALKLKELRERMARDSKHFEKAKKSNYISSQVAFGFDLTKFPLLSLTEQLTLAQMKDEVPFDRQLAQWLGAESSWPE